jgi:C4-type Zn-finger protein
MLKEEIKRMFSDPEEVLKNSKPVENLPPGTRDCPHCGGPLRFPKHTVKWPNTETMVKFPECEKCDLPFMVEALS